MNRSPLPAVCLACTLASAGCIDEGEFGRFDQAEVLTFALESQTRSASIDGEAREIVVTLASDDDGAEARIAELTLSSLATASVEVGDTLDLREAYVLKVRAEDGTVVPWTILARHEAPPPSRDAGGPDDEDAGEQDASAGCESVLVTYEISGVLETTDTP